MTLVTFLGWTALSASAHADAPPLVHSEANAGFTLDEDWRQAWRRIEDRAGRPDPTGPIQQRFRVKMYPEHETDIAVGGFTLGRERQWELSRKRGRFWIHSYDARELGNQVQLKLGRAISSIWDFDMRYDRLDTRNVRSSMLQVDFTWHPNPKKDGLFTIISVFPRFEKQDTDLGVTLGYRVPWLGEARLRLIGLDAFTNGSYALAKNRKPPAPLVWSQNSIPLAVSLELVSERLGPWRTETYLGAVVPQERELHLGGFKDTKVIDDRSYLAGTMVEYKWPEQPVWFGASGLINFSRWESKDYAIEDSYQKVTERNVQSRLYAFAVPDEHYYLETWFRVTARPQSVFGPGAYHSEREDNEYMYSARLQWLMSDQSGAELSYWYTNRKTSGPPAMFVDGAGNRIVTRFLFRFAGLLATFGVGWDPDPRRAIYGGGGASIVADFE